MSLGIYCYPISWFVLYRQLIGAIPSWDWGYIQGLIKYHHQTGVIPFVVWRYTKLEFGVINSPLMIGVMPSGD